MKQLRVGIIGQGRSGRNIHAQHLAGVPRKFKIVAVADILPDRRVRAEQEYGCLSFSDYREMLRIRDLDLIVNATPSCLHVPIAKEILKAGFHVLCEKPLARRAAEVDELIELSKKAGRILAIYQQYRFAPCFQQILKVVASGVLGRIVMIRIASNGFSRRWDWQTLQEMNGGSLLNTGPHPLDQALALLGGKEMPEVWCRMDRVNSFGDAEDHVKILLSGPRRPTVDLEISSCCAYPLYYCQIYGSQGGLTGDTKRLQWRYFKPREAPPQRLIREPLPGPSYCSEKLRWHERAWEAPKSKAQMFPTMARAFYSNLYDALTRGAPLEVTPQQVRRQIAVIEECHRQSPLPRMASKR